MRYQGLELMKKLQSKANRACLLIDYNRDLGTFDEETWSFIEPVEQLVNPITHRAYTKKGQALIEELRAEYLKFLDTMRTEFKTSKQADDLEIVRYLSGKGLKPNELKEITEYIEWQLALGKSISEIAKSKKVPYKAKTLRNKFRASDYYLRGDVVELTPHLLAVNKVKSYLQKTQSR